MPDSLFADVVAEIVEARVARIETAIPAEVVAYDRTTQRARVRPLVRGAYADPDTGERVEYDLPEVAEVPVAFPGAGDVSITWDLGAGDAVILVVASRDFSPWLATGTTRGSPNDPRRHDLTDAIAVPEIRPASNPRPAAAVAAGALVLRGADVRLGSATASAYVALASLVDARLSALAGAFSSWTPVPGDGGAALKTVLSALTGGGWPASTAASKVRAE